MPSSTRFRDGFTQAIRAIVIAAIAICSIGTARPAAAYSVLSHEANIDALWDSTMAPMLRERFPDATPEQLLEARGYAYGGCVIQDLGYYPFGSHFFSNLLHYVRSGEFIEALIRDAQDVNEYAFALGALAHYSADNEGHPRAVNPAVALMYPKLKAQFGDAVTYEQSPKNHLMVEFSFDVVQVAAHAYAPEAYHSFIGFHVATPLLERAFSETYGIEMKDLFFNEDLAIGTYRHAVAVTIPEMTKVAWGKKRAAILTVVPGAKKKTFVFNLRRREYEKEFGNNYEKPHGFARFLAFVYRLVPKIGPFRSLRFSVPSPEAERLFLASFTVTRERFRASLDALREGHLRLANTNFDTGKIVTAGVYGMADQTYDELLGKLAEHGFAAVPGDLRANLLAFYGDVDRLPGGTNAARKRSAVIRRQLASLVAATPATTTAPTPTLPATPTP